MTSLVPTRPDPDDLAAYQAAATRAQQLARNARSGRTLKEYARDWAAFKSWCSSAAVNCMPAPPEVLCSYIAALEARGLRLATIERAVCSISQAHQVAGQPNPRYAPQVREVLKGLRRTVVAPIVKKAALSPGQLRAMLRKVAPGMRGTRDRAMLLIGFAGGLRRSELAALDVSDVRFVPEGVVVRLRRSKTDQEGKGVQLAILTGSALATCPVRSLAAWLEAREARLGDADGPLFTLVGLTGWCSPERVEAGSIARLVKRLAGKAGIDPSLVSGHSLRAGFITTASKLHRPLHSIMQHSRHVRYDTVRGYIREGELFNEDNPTKGITDADF